MLDELNILSKSRWKQWEDLVWDLAKTEFHRGREQAPPAQVSLLPRNFRGTHSSNLILKIPLSCRLFALHSSNKQLSVFLSFPSSLLLFPALLCTSRETTLKGMIFTVFSEGVHKGVLIRICSWVTGFS